MNYLYILRQYLLTTYSITGAIAASGYYIDYISSFHIIDVNCTGEEDSIWNCSYNVLINYTCPSSHDASLQCQGNCYIFDITVLMRSRTLAGVSVVMLVCLQILCHHCMRTC